MAEIVDLNDTARVVLDKVIYYHIDSRNKKNFNIVLEGPYIVENLYNTEEQCMKNFKAFDKIMKETKL